MQLWPANANAFAASFAGSLDVRVLGDDHGCGIAELELDALPR